MLGWEVFVYRRITRPSPTKSEEVLLARWKTALGGIQWLDALVKENKAFGGNGDGYPTYYTVTAGVLLPILSRGLPSHNSPPVIGEDYELPRGWNDEMKLDNARIADCTNDEHLLIEAWDQS